MLNRDKYKLLVMWLIMMVMDEIKSDDEFNRPCYMDPDFIKRCMARTIMVQDHLLNAPVRNLIANHELGWCDIWVVHTSDGWQEVVHQEGDDDPLTMSAGYLLNRLWRLWEFYGEGSIDRNTMVKQMDGWLNIIDAQRKVFGS